MKTFLFESKELAEEVAFTLKAEKSWDGLNAIELPHGNKLLLETAAGIAGANYCLEGKRCKRKNLT